MLEDWGEEMPAEVKNSAIGLIFCKLYKSSNTKLTGNPVFNFYYIGKTGLDISDFIPDPSFWLLSLFRQYTFFTVEMDKRELTACLIIEFGKDNFVVQSLEWIRTLRIKIGELWAIVQNQNTQRLI